MSQLKGIDPLDPVAVLGGRTAHYRMAMEEALRVQSTDPMIQVMAMRRILRVALAQSTDHVEEVALARRAVDRRRANPGRPKKAVTA